MRKRFLLICILMIVVIVTTSCGGTSNSTTNNTNTAEPTQSNSSETSTSEVIDIDEFTISLPSSWHVANSEDGYYVIQLDNCKDGLAIIGVVEAENVSIQNEEDINGVIKDFVDKEGLEIMDEFYLDAGVAAYAYTGTNKENDEQAMAMALADAQKGMLVIELLVDLDSVDTCYGEFDELMDNISSKVSSAAATDQPSNENPKEASIEESVIYDDDYCTITAKGLTPRGKGYELNLLIENKSDLNLGFNAHAWAANGIMSGNNIYDMDVDAAAGKKANAKLEIDEDALYDGKLETLDLLIWAYDNDAFFKEFDTGQIHLETSQNTGDIIQYTNVEKLFEDSGITVSYQGEQNNTYFFVVRNETGRYIEFDIDDVSINDFTNSDTDYDLISIMLLNNCEVSCGIKVGDEFMSQNDIASVEEIEFNLEIRPDGSFMDDYKVGPITKTL